MHALNVKLAGAEGVMSLFYKTEEEAKKASDQISSADQHVIMVVSDDCGNELRTFPRNILATFLVDLMKDIARQQEMALIQMREQAKLQSKASTDPALRFMQGMPGMNMSGLNRQ